MVCYMKRRTEKNGKGPTATGRQEQESSYTVEQIICCFPEELCALWSTRSHEQAHVTGASFCSPHPAVAVHLEHHFCKLLIIPILRLQQCHVQKQKLSTQELKSSLTDIEGQLWAGVVSGCCELWTGVDNDIHCTVVFSKAF